METKGQPWLSESSSPWLRMHAGLQLPWRPWGAAAFAEAARLDRPLLVVIGCASSRTCVSMVREVYPEDDAAGLQREHFVSVLVDRVERPDVARVFMVASRLLTRTGAWPLHAFLTPAGLPFHMVPALAREGDADRPPWRETLREVVSAWTERREEVEEAASSLAALVRGVECPWPERAGDVGSEQAGCASREALGDAEERVRARLMEGVDWAEGGFRSVPKRPMVPQLDLLARAVVLGDEDAEDALSRALDALAGSPLRSAEGGWHGSAKAADWSAAEGEREVGLAGLILRLLAEAARLELPVHVGDGALRRSAIDDAIAWLDGPMRSAAGTLARAMGGAGEGSAVDARSVAVSTAWAVQGLARVALLRGEEPTLSLARGLMDALLSRHVDERGALWRIVDGARVPGFLEDWAALLQALVDLHTASGEVRWLRHALSLADVMVAQHSDPDDGHLQSVADPGPLFCPPSAVEDEALPAALPTLCAALLRLAALSGRADFEPLVDRVLANEGGRLEEADAALASLARLCTLRREGIRVVLCVLPRGEGERTPERSPAGGVPGGAIVSLTREEAQALFGPEASGRPAASRTSRPDDAGGGGASGLEQANAAVDASGEAREALHGDARAGDAARQAAAARRHAAPHLAPEDVLCIIREGEAPPELDAALLQGRRALGGRPTFYICVGRVCGAPMHALDEVEMLEA